MIRPLFMFFMLLPLFGIAQQTASSAAAKLKQDRFQIRQHFLSNPRSPLDANSVKRLTYFAHDPAFTFDALILPATDTAALNFPTSDGREKLYRPYAKVYFRHDDQLHSLVVFEPVGKKFSSFHRDLLFLPFYDETNGEETYGGGRYLQVSRSDVDARELVLDFNLAYNPWCAYADDFSCPIPPAENRLAIPIRAGERNFTRETP